jgi:hypothetical protein
MQLALMSAPGTATMGDQLVIACVEAEGVIPPAEPHITLRSPKYHAAIVRRPAQRVHAVLKEGRYCIA